MVYKWLNIGLSWLYPHLCPLCGTKSQSGFCAGCEQDLPVLQHHCLRCGIGLPDVCTTTCGHCQANPPYFQQVISAYLYQPPVSQLIAALKYQQRLSLLPAFATALVKCVQRNAIPVDVILPVPLHHSRVRTRGFNQSLELARHLARQMSLPIANNVERHLATASQASLSSQQRQQNVRGAFRICAPLHYRRIAIVDDVVTTGSTVNEIARLLKSGGADEIQVWCIARAV